MEKLGQAGMTQRERQVVCISQDSFYKELTPAERSKAVRGQLNFDHPGKQFFDIENRNLHVCSHMILLEQ